MRAGRKTWLVLVSIVTGCKWREIFYCNHTFGDTKQPLNAALRAVPFSNSPSLGDSGTEGEECLLLLPDLSLSFSLTRSFTLSFTSFSLLLLRSFSLSFVFGSFTFSAFSLFTFSLGLSFCSLSFSFSLFFCLLSNILREMQRKKRFTPLVYSLVDKKRYFHGKA